MTNKQKELNKDAILRFLSENQHQNIDSRIISDKLSLDHKVVLYMLEQLQEEWFVFNPMQKIEPRPDNYSTVYIPNITNKGVFFLEIDGGHESRLNSLNVATRYKTLQKIALIANAVAIIILTIINIGVEFYFKKNDKELEILRKQNEILKSHLELIKKH